MCIDRICLIDIFNDYSPIDEAVGLGSISAVLRKNGYKTKLLAYKQSKINYDEVVDFRPNIIGFSVQPRNVDIVNKVSIKLSELLPGTLMVIGGYLPTNCPNEILSSMEKIDIAIRGEGEYTFLNLVNAWKQNDELKNIDGISYKDHGVICHNKDRAQIPDLDSLPFPDRDIIIRHKIHVARVEGARGCTGRCSFCSIHGFWSNNHSKNCQVWRTKSIKRFVDELEYLSKEYNISRFHFLDSSYENPYMNSERMKQIAKEILRRKLNITYYINVRADFHKIATKELLQLLVRSGLNTVFVGVESFNEADLVLYNKNISVEDNIKTIEILKDNLIRTDIGLINFHPYTTLDNLRNNAIMLHKYGFSSRLLLRNKLMVFNGCALFEKIKKDNLLSGVFYEIKDYKFINKEVEILNQYIEEYIKNINRMNDDVLIKLDVYEHRHLSLLAHLKHYFELENDQTAVKIVEEYEANIGAILADLNNKNTSWFIKLLDLSKQGWSNECADDIMNTYMSANYLKDLFKKFKQNNLLLYIRLTKINKEYANLL